MVFRVSVVAISRRNGERALQGYATRNRKTAANRIAAGRNVDNTAANPSGLIECFLK